ncbi:DcaP family trimeric outer membrane transporter [Marinobacter sp.]|uniref:DcaP family trimeric outer membrane transporter n=1 Tax=Marinobacter sp. TaxID=50741 RepID=UPI002E8C1E1F|nr:DcaP family trimeric outer membrane transporter [Pseudomonadota bacterium]MEE3116997.1 DcaP family trimeric outer membrane transporter [Pseudomonadota bacterium]
MRKNKLNVSIQVATALLAIGTAGSANAMKIVGDANDKNLLDGVSVEIYGYARLNASYDIDEDISGGARTGDFSKVNTGADENNEISGHFGADAFQSRIGVLTTHSSGLKVRIESDFETNGNGLRLRHAYGEYMGVMAGQNWSNYTSFVGYTPTLDFDGLPGSAGVQFRSAQLRYTTGPLSVSLEEPLSYNGLIDSAGGGDEKEGLPVLTARLEDSAGAISYSVAGFVRNLGYDTGTEDDSAVAYGAFGAVTMAVSDAIKFNGVINYTNGSNTYLYRSGENYAAEDGYVDPATGDLELISGYGGTVGMTYDIGGGRSVNVGVGMTNVDWDDALRDLGPGTINDKHEKNTSALINYQWSPVKHATMGIEYGYYMVDEVDGDDGDASRLLFAAQYNF